MRFSDLAFGLMLLVGLPASPAHSASTALAETVKSGAKEFIGAHYALDPSTCRPDKPSFQVIVAPSHGKFTTGRSSGILPGKNVCSGTKSQLIDLYYQSTPNFRGQDTLQIKFTRENGRPGGDFVYTITVK